MKKSIKTTLLALTIAGTFCMTCYAADFSNYWYQDGSTWKIHDQSGNTIANAWVCDNAVTVNHNTDTNWYLMDASGNMYEGIIQDQNGDYYLLNPEHNGTYGMMLTANGFTYNGVTYQFNQAHDGTFGKILNTQDIGRSGLKVSQVNTAGRATYYTNDFRGSGSSSGGSSGSGSSGSQQSASGTQSQPQSESNVSQVIHGTDGGGVIMLDDTIPDEYHVNFSQEFLDSLVGRESFS